MLTIARDVLDAVVAHAQQCYPDEACGVIAGPEGSDRPERFIPIPNSSDSPPTFYEFSSADLFALYRGMAERGEDPVVVFHSHTATEAYPSPTDVRIASEPYAHYLLVAIADDVGEKVRSYRIVDGVVTEEEVVVVPALDPA